MKIPRNEDGRPGDRPGPPATTSITATARKRDQHHRSGTVTDPAALRALAALATVPHDVPLGFWRRPDGSLTDIPITVDDAREGLLDGTTDPAAVIGTVHILRVVGVLPGGAA